MAKPSKTRFTATMALLRGAIMLAAGAFALLSPSNALIFIVVGGGCLIVIDGVMSLASQDFGAERHWPFWVALARGGIAVAVGLLVLFSPYLVGIMTMGTLAALCGLAAIVVGILEAIIIVRDRKAHDAFWAPLAAAALYVALGLILLFLPLSGALMAVRIGGIFLVALGLMRLMQAWKEVQNAPGTRSRA